MSFLFCNIQCHVQRIQEIINVPYDATFLFLPCLSMSMRPDWLNTLHTLDSWNAILHAVRSILLNRVNIS